VCVCVKIELLSFINITSPDEREVLGERAHAMIRAIRYPLEAPGMKKTSLKANW
jgi:hypothetical protein